MTQMDNLVLLQQLQAIGTREARAFLSLFKCNNFEKTVERRCIMSPKSTKTPLKRERSPFKDVKSTQNEENVFANQENEEPSEMHVLRK